MAKYSMLPLAAVVMLLCAGAADATTCAAGYKDCDKNYYLNGCEVNVHTDVNNCGDCGVKCVPCANAVPKCMAAKCEYACNAPWANCDDSWANGCEVDVSKDDNNCGGCGKKCSPVANASVQCSNHQCVYTCNAGWKNCDNNWLNGCETEVSKNVNACGACGTKCVEKPNAVTKCEDHKCVYSCKPGYANCNNNWDDGCEGQVSTDVNNCGTCGAKCVEKPNSVTKCENHKCVYSCKPGFANCNNNWDDGCEGQVSTDVNNCGACGSKCVEKPYAVTKCENHKCVYSCKAGWANCNNNWNDGCESYPSTDVYNCGGCWKKCPEPKYTGGEARCTNGRCETQSCKKGMKYDGGRRCCVNDGGNNGGGGGKGGNGGGKGGNGGGKGGNGGGKGGNGGGKGGNGGGKGGNGGGKGGNGGGKGGNDGGRGH